ncbi:FtsQ-type POTRA domain-containing protein [Xylophilus rhododendri]|uniref:Cell division protein FtsQ n=1 Tax=Xylophilus rhododendri TaxID=2697032 RepID=A0A857J6W2_9BURK|nr:cell division protein FtsQ/DivIB [Xylophilus rhododendri]QHI99750.1 FtsQ-type POTRA domain-containing protein [Xylophilus rhododendri]
MTDATPAPFDVRLMNVTAAVLFAGCAAMLLAAAGWWTLRNPAFALGAIVIEGKLSHNNPVTLRANVAHKLEGSFFTVNLRTAREAFEAVPWIRHADVRREFPNRLLVTLEEHVPVAYWGPESGSAMVNSFGEVFEANVADVENEDLPRLAGPQGHAPEVLEMQHVLEPVFAPLEMSVTQLELSGRGSWRLTLDDGPVVELGGGSTADLLERTRRFARTLTQVAAKYGRRADALASADLRHADGYAIRLNGVTTMTVEQAAAIARKNMVKAID